MGVEVLDVGRRGAPWPARAESLAGGSEGSLVAQLARGPEDVAAAQALRHEVFYVDRGLSGRATDADSFDALCDHILVIDTDTRALVGTYRLLPQQAAEKTGGFYTQDEFDLAPLLQRKRHLRFLELGRSCVLKEYRTKPVIGLLWRAIWAYARRHRVDTMFGCASLEGADPALHAEALGYLARHHMAPSDWRVAAQPSRRIDMQGFAVGAIDDRAALRSMPALIKGYLRLGAFVGDGAVVDRAFNTVDVLIVLSVAAIGPRYVAHFGSAPDPLRDENGP